jgi:hypothetical protein
MSKIALERRIRFLLIFFMLALSISGITAIPLEWGSNLLVKLFGANTQVALLWPAMAEWLETVRRGIAETQKNAPFIFYGTDWLAFAHIVIAIAFIGPLRDPVKNIWVIEFGMLACVLLIPWGMIFAIFRGIPLFWLPIDFSFGVFGFLPLWLVRKYILEVAKYHQQDSL